MNQDLIKDEIVNGIKNAQTKLGFTLVSEDWGGQGYSCSCALGCLIASKEIVISSDAGENIAQAEKILQVDENWVVSFITGFDDSPPDPDYNKDAYHLGQDIHNEFKPIRNDLYMSEWYKEQKHNVSE
jgi:hypothetical protein